MLVAELVGWLGRVQQRIHQIARIVVEKCWYVDVARLLDSS